MTTTTDSRYELLAAQFQYQQIALLKAALEKHGIARDLAQEICGDFTFDLSVFLDQGEIEWEGQGFRPTIAFTADEENFLVQPDDVEYHLHAFNSTREVFDSPGESPTTGAA
jgi:hypothetical protein